MCVLCCVVCGSVNNKIPLLSTVVCGALLSYFSINSMTSVNNIHHISTRREEEKKERKKCFTNMKTGQK